jgi:actin beta/gamma 1
MYNNIVLSGGSTMMNGFSDRIYNGMLNIKDSNNFNVQVIAEGNRNISAWIGGSMVASMSSFSNAFITKDDFSEIGENKNFFQKVF